MNIKTSVSHPHPSLIHQARDRARRSVCRALMFMLSFVLVGAVTEAEANVIQANKTYPPPNGSFRAAGPAYNFGSGGSAVQFKDVAFTFFDNFTLMGAPGGTITFNAQFSHNLSTDGGATWSGEQAATAAFSITLGAVSGNDHSFTINSLTISGGDLPAAFQLRKLAVVGTPVATFTPNTPSVGLFTIDNTFYLSLELSQDSGGTWTPSSVSGGFGTPSYVLAPLSNEEVTHSPTLPPGDGQYYDPDQYHAAFANGIVVRNPLHNGFLGQSCTDTNSQPGTPSPTNTLCPPPILGQTQTEDFTSKMRFDVEMPGLVHVGPIDATVQTRVLHSHDSGVIEIYRTKMLQLDPNPGSLPPGMNFRINPDPTRPSLGMTTLRPGPTPDTTNISSSFALRLQMTTDGGATWQDADQFARMQLQILPTLTNSIGVAAGFNLITLQLDNTNGLDALQQPEDGDQAYRWDVASQDLDPISPTYFTGFGWMPNFVPAPGEAFFYVASTARTLTYSGTPRTPVLPLTITPNRFYALGRQVDGVGTYENIMGVSPGIGSQFNRWDPNIQDYVTNIFNGSTWSAGVPFANPGEGVFVYPTSGSSLQLNCLSNKTVNASSTNWTFDTPATSGGCSNVSVVVLSTVTNGPCPLTVTRTWRATDSCSNSVVCSQTVTINNDLFSITCPSNIVTYLSGGSTVPVSWSSTVTSGTFLGCSPSSGSPFALGVTTVTCYGTDGCLTNSCSFTVTVLSNGPPVITGQPTSLTWTQDQSGTLAVAVTGAAPFNYQWYFNGAVLVGETGSILTIPGVQPENFGSYFVVVSNPFGTATSAVAAVTISTPSQPGAPCCGVKPTFAGVAAPNAYASFAGQIAVVTSFTLNPNAPVLSIFDLQNSAAPVDVNYLAPVFHGPASAPWTKSRLGNIFGVCFDGAGNIYVAASTVYNETPDTAGPGGLEAVYKIDGVTGLISTFVVLPNAGKAGLGNIKYSCEHQNFYVSNLGDGKIYRLDLNGNILGTFDHGAGLPTASPPSAAILDDPVQAYTQLGRRVWGLKPHRGRLYYGVWWEHSNSADPARNNEIWSVALNASGAPIAGTQAREIIQPPLTAGGNWANPCSDISFSPAGQMLIAERTMTGESTSWAHASRMIEASGCCGAWSLNTTKYFANPCFGPSGAGGVDYDQSTGGRVWATGDALHYPSTCAGNPDYIYGIFGLPLAGGNTHNSVLIDVNGVTSLGNKTQIGDVELPCPPPRCLIITNEVLNCVNSNGTYSYKFCATNFLNEPVAYITLLDPPPGVTFTPDIISLGTPLLPGQGGCFEVTINYAGPAPTNFCFRFGAHSTNFAQCCATAHCVTLPSCCAYIYNESMRPIPGQLNCYNYTFTLRNTTPDSIQYVILVPEPAGCYTVTPDVLVLPTPLLPNQSVTRTVKVCLGTLPPCNQPFTYVLSIHNTNFVRCCAVRQRAPRPSWPVQFPDGLDGTAVLAGGDLTLPVLVDTSEVQPSQVTVFDGTNVIGTLTNPVAGQHLFTVSNAPVGVHTFRAREIDTLGGEWEAPPVSLFVYGDGEPIPELSPANLRLLRPSLVNGKINLSLATGPGVTYWIECTDSLVSPNWQVIHTLVGDGSVMTRTDTLVISPQRFYRVRTP